MTTNNTLSNLTSEEFQVFVQESGIDVDNLQLDKLSANDLFQWAMETVAKLHKLDIDYKQEGWNIDFNKEGVTVARLLSYDFGLNNAQAFTIAKNKALTSRFLTASDVSHVEHHQLTHTSLFNDVDSRKVFDDFKANNDFPCVVKQSNGGGGKNIYFAYNDFDLVMAIAELKARNAQISLSPYYDFGIEYRCTVLNGEVLMAYGKTKGENQQNNLSKGAQVVDVPESLKEDLYALAVKTNNALGLDFTNIDIIDTAGGLRVLEVNGTVTMKRVLCAGHKYIYNTLEVYYKAIEEVLKRKTK